jgi:TPR repeat protein
MNAGYDMNCSHVQFLCGFYCADIKRYDLAKKYYLMAIQQGNVVLGSLYERFEKDYILMKKYYLMAIEKGKPTAMLRLGYHYHFVEKDYGLMKKYYLMAIKRAIPRAMNNLAYNITNKWKWIMY